MADGDISIVFAGLDVTDFAGIIPTPEEIGAINRARTDDGQGDTLGTFTTETRPTADDVDILRGLAVNQIADRLGNNIPEEFEDRARGAAALIGAALVETSTRDPREQLIRIWTTMADDRIKQLAVEIAAVGAGGEEGPSDDMPLPSYNFPDWVPLPEEF